MLSDSLTTTKLTTEEAIVAGGIAGGIFATLGIALLIFYVIMVIATWKIFTKAGEKGWKSLIPVYNAYLLFKIVGMKNWFWAILGISFAYGLVTSILAPEFAKIDTIEAAKAFDWGKNWIVLVLTIAFAIFSLVSEIIYVKRTAKAFGKGTGFAVGLFFLTPIFWLILGYGSAKYDKKALKD